MIQIDCPKTQKLMLCNKHVIGQTATTVRLWDMTCQKIFNTERCYIDVPYAYRRGLSREVRRPSMTLTMTKVRYDL